MHSHVSAACTLCRLAPLVARAKDQAFLSRAGAAPSCPRPHSPHVCSQSHVQHAALSHCVCVHQHMRRCGRCATHHRAARRCCPTPSSCSGVCLSGRGATLAWAHSWVCGTLHVNTHIPHSCSCGRAAQLRAHARCWAQLFEQLRDAACLLGWLRQHTQCAVHTPEPPATTRLSPAPWPGPAGTV